MWIARDKDKKLYLFTTKPRRVSEWGEWWSVDSPQNYNCSELCEGLSEGLFPDLRWEDEPIEVDLVRKEVNHVGSER